MAWVSPTGFVDNSDWRNEARAYDGNTGTRAEEYVRGFLDLTRAAIDCSKIRIYCQTYLSLDAVVDIDVYYEGGWHDVFEGVISRNVWVEKSIPAGTKSVSKARVRSASGTEMDLWEFEFWE